jgi:two-component system cell cycle sensor histidine kinase/response regulator CckA
MRPITTLLLVEDNAGDARLLREMFRDQGEGGAVLTHVETLAAALAHLARERVDIILLDLGLPDAQGIAVVERVHAAAPDVPLGVLTGQDDERLSARALRAGAQDYLIKGQLETRGLARALRYSVQRKVMEVALSTETERLHESEEQYRVLFDSNPHPMYVFDAETLQFLAVNDAAVQHYGYSREELLRMTVAAIRPAGEIPALMHSIADALKDHPPSQSLGVFNHRKKDGTAVPMEVAANRIRLRGRKAWLVLAMDVTDRRSLEAQLLQSQRMESVGRLAGGVAHDFNNLLGVITGYGELLKRRVKGDPNLEKYAGDIVKAAERAAGLTRQLLAFSRKQVLLPKTLDLNVVVGEMERMLRRVIGEDVQLVTAFDERLGPVKADAGQMEQVLMNLAVNARDAMAQGGCLTIETANVSLDEVYARHHAGVVAGPYVMLAVSDTGEGMAEDVQTRIFEPFFTTKAEGVGTGLGLAMVHGIVKQSGGHIWLYSEPGRGTTFKIYLPRLDATEDVAASPEIAASLRRGSETVLLVEDEESLREIIRACLEDTGYTVLDAGHGKDAVSVCERHPGAIDLLLTDVVMPGIGGPLLAERLRVLRPHMRTIYMSGYTDDAVVHHGVDAGDLAFLQKPFTAVALACKVREVLDAPS